MAVIRIKEIHDTEEAALAARSIAKTLDRLGKRVFTKSDLLRLIGKHRVEWRILDRVSPKKIIDYLLTAFPLRKIVLSSLHYTQEFPRYLWREADPLELAASVRSPNSYLCHSSALFMHGLADELPKEICVNYEQSPKAKPSGGLTQASLDRAFRVKQRQSKFTFRYANHMIVVLSGKNTGGLDVLNLAIPSGAKLRVTNIERTLIDVTVRSAYAGSTANVLEAYRRAQSRISIDKILATLQRLDHLYPYHQAIGFYMERAGYPQRHLAKLRSLGMNLDFYLAHGMKKAAYDKNWRLHHPVDF